MSKGYQLLETPCLSDLVAAPKNFDLSVAVLSWLVEVISEELKEQLDRAEIEVIRAEYFGAYPALGIHYKGDPEEDLGPIVEAMAAKVLRERPVSDFVSYLMRAGTDWRKVTDDIVGPRP
jgi:hypothetical protein